MNKKTTHSGKHPSRSSPTPKGKEESAKNELHRFEKGYELVFVLLFFIAIFSFIALLTFNSDDAPNSDVINRTSGWLGQAGASVGYWLSVITFGRFGAFAIPLSVFLFLVWWITRKRFKPGKWIAGVLITGFFIGFGISFIRNWLSLKNNLIQPEDVLSGWAMIWLAEESIKYLQFVGTSIVFIILVIIFGILLLDLKPSKFLSDTYDFITGLFNGQEKPIEEVDEEEKTVVEEEIIPNVDVFDDEEPAELPAISRKVKKTSPVKEDFTEDGALMETPGSRSLPPLKLLDPPPPDRPEVDPSELEDNARRLEEKLASLKVSAEVIKTNPGPIITRYDLKPAAEVKIARIANLSDDIAMALRARGVRILAPIPGEAAVGVEIPNRKSQTVYIREVIGSSEFSNVKAPLTIALGKDTRGGIFCTDLASMPHLLIAGATGSGKSVCINTIIASLLYRSDPRDVRFVLVDPKKIELSLYGRLSEQHLISPPGLGEKVITTPENAVKTLQSVHTEMERRYTILAEAGVRGLDEYNRWIENTAPENQEEKDTREHLPYLVVIIDELADLMMTVRREFEELVARLAQMARAVGIHLIVATQRPSVDVVTGLIKANFPSRIAFKVASKFDSRTILDAIGAEALLGKGDMLFVGPGSSKLTRLHGALITTEEVERIIEFVRAQPRCNSSFVLPYPEEARPKVSVNGYENERTDADEFFEEAARIVVRTEQGSVSVLQRRLRVGYARAARLIDELEKAGIVGPFDGSKARQVMVTPEELREIHGIEI